MLARETLEAARDSGFFGGAILCLTYVGVVHNYDAARGRTPQHAWDSWRQYWCGQLGVTLRRREGSGASRATALYINPPSHTLTAVVLGRGFEEALAQEAQRRSRRRPR